LFSLSKIAESLKPKTASNHLPPAFAHIASSKPFRPKPKPKQLPAQKERSAAIAESLKPSQFRIFLQLWRWPRPLQKQHSSNEKEENQTFLSRQESLWIFPAMELLRRPFAQ
jgi:hypothetical protein